ncbi:MAG TPA: Ig-like domain-containing protein [Streptosporangiaceae bacterium]|nr:Ig-like domain-containing protein [Streptosporangiaceae bacterium]
MRSWSFSRRGAAFPRRGAAVAATLVLLTVTACGGGKLAAHSPAGHQLTQALSPTALSISPASGSRAAAPSQGITVTAAHGAVSHVTVMANGSPMPGTLSQGGTVWHSQWTLGVSQRYTVTATATDSVGHRVTATSAFRTLTPSQTFQTQIFEGYNQTYGIGMPIKLTFSRAVTNRAAVERSLQIKTSKPVVGAWHWDGSQQLDFRPQAYWPAGTQVTFTGHLDGVQGAPGVYGFHTLTQTFNIGASLIVVASTTTHHMSLYYNGRRIHYWPISTGRPGDNTPDGTYLTIEKANPVDMKGPGYNIEVPWSVRITWSGDYLHDAYWSTGEQGFTNVSHGCVNMAPADAEMYYKMAIPGDPVTITGSPRAGVWDNGWTDWFLSWQQLAGGSALHEAVQAGPDGSTFVNPATLPQANASPPLQTSPPDNAAAA